MMDALTVAVELRNDLTLPQGRYLMTREQVSKIWGFNDHRRRVIDGGFLFVDALKERVPIRSVWISGSLLTDKEVPSDFDVTLLVDAQEHAAMSNGLLSRESLVRFASRLGASIDPYVLSWRPYTGDWRKSEQDTQMLTWRGYWDDWWLRRRGRTDGETENVEATPRRGYVEVMINGYA